MNYIVIDLVILAVLLISAFLGMRRGLILSLCSLIAVLVAFVGAILISNYLAPPVAGWIEPRLAPTVETAVQSMMPEDVLEVEQSLDRVTQMLEEANLPFGLGKFADELLESLPQLDGNAVIQNMTDVLTEKLAGAIAHAGLFLIAFLLILLVWHLLSRTLDLVVRLPVLRTMNKLGGFVFGGVRGVLILFVCGWVVRWLASSLIPADALEQTVLLRFFVTTNPLDYLAKF